MQKRYKMCIFFHYLFNFFYTSILHKQKMTENLPNNHKDKGDIHTATRYHCFTLNNYTSEDEIEFQEYIKDKKDYFQFVSNLPFLL